MREILFRGKRKLGNEWIEGSLHTEKFTDDEEYLCCEVCQCDVYPETVGQYIGLTDKNGKKIFEGDIVHAIYKSGYTGIPDKDFGIGVIKYNGTYYSGAAYQIDIIGEPGCRVFSASLQVEVIGNIHDNPELLKGGAK